jgi:hypothetical protein
MRLGLVLAGFWIVVGAPLVVASVRYAKKQRRLGVWNENGPLHPTERPQDETTKNVRNLTGGIYPPP